MAVGRPARTKSGFLEKVLDRLTRLDPAELQAVVQRLQRERAILETLFNTIEDGVIVADPEGRVIFLNHAAGRLLGVAPESVLQQPVARLLPELDWETLRRTVRGNVVRRELEIGFPRPRFLRLFVAPVDDDATGGGVALVLHDTTEMRDQTREVVEAERGHALTLLAASVAHEIGNPLNALHIHLQLMEREVRRLQSGDPAADPAAIADRLQGFLDVAKGEIGRLDYIVTDFLHAMRPSPPKLRPASVNDVVRETLEILRPELANRRLRVVEKLAPDVPPVRLDPAQLKQALMNLIKNAMQAMTKSGTLTLATAGTSAKVWITVTDTGCGIPADQLSRLFQPFHTTKEKGTGLGLMIVQRIIRDHGGGIDLESQPGKGTSFKIWLPRPDRLPQLLPPG